MTDGEKRLHLIEWAVGWTNNEDIRDTSELTLFIERAMSHDERDGKKSESLGDYSVTYEESALNTYAMQYLKKYRKLRW